MEVSTQSFSKRKLVSNWDRYEENIDLHRFEKDDDDGGAEFEELLSMPSSGKENIHHLIYSFVLYICGLNFLYLSIMQLFSNHASSNMTFRRPPQIKT